MLQFLSAFASIFKAIAEYFQQKQLIDAGKAEETVKQIEVVQEHVEQAKVVDSTPDPVRDERLQNRFDRSRSK